MNAVLATDMTQHMRLLDAFSEGRSEQPNLATWGDSDVLLQLVLHTADLCNPCRPLLFSIKWGELICCEFLEQVTPLCSCTSFIMSDGQSADVQSSHSTIVAFISGNFVTVSRCRGMVSAC